MFTCIDVEVYIYVDFNTINCTFRGRGFMQKCTIMPIRGYAYLYSWSPSAPSESLCMQWHFSHHLIGSQACKYIQSCFQRKICRRSRYHLGDLLHLKNSYTVLKMVKFLISNGFDTILEMVFVAHWTNGLFLLYLFKPCRHTRFLQHAI